MTTQTHTTLYMLTLLQVMQRTGLSRSTLYNKLDPDSPYYDPSFPTQVRIGSAVRWVEAEVNAWLEQCVMASRGGSLTGRLSLHAGGMQ